MLILSQDMDVLLNIGMFQKVVVRGAGNEWLVSADNVSDEDFTDMAAYGTKERACEVLREIYNEYGKYISAGGTLANEQPLVFKPPAVYKMPAE